MSNADKNYMCLRCFCSKLFTYTHQQASERQIFTAYITAHRISNSEPKIQFDSVSLLFSFFSIFFSLAAVSAFNAHFYENICFLYILSAYYAVVRRLLLRLCVAGRFCLRQYCYFDLQ